MRVNIVNDSFRLPLAWIARFARLFIAAFTPQNRILWAATVAEDI
jgi:hypothetical protein